MAHQQETRNGKIIVAILEGDRVELMVDGSPVIVQRDDDAGTPSYFTPRFAFQRFSSLIELGRKLADES